MAVVVGGVVDQDLHPAPVGAQAGDGGLGAIDVGQVLVDEAHAVAAARQPGGERLGRFRLDVDEGHARALRGERRDDELADAGAAAGDQDASVAQRRILRVPARIRRKHGVSVRHGPMSSVNLDSRAGT